MHFEAVPPNQDAVDPEAMGERSKLGGQPDWEQNDETPRCPDCGETMTFVGQIDSVEHESKTNPHAVNALSPDQQYMFGDVGLIYVFFCFECSRPAALFQCG
jgi:uncharacterized protein YwqG